MDGDLRSDSSDFTESSENVQNPGVDNKSQQQKQSNGTPKKATATTVSKSST